MLYPTDERPADEQSPAPDGHDGPDADGTAMAGGVVVGLFSAWGFLEQYAAWPRFPVILAFPLFWAAYGIAVVLLWMASGIFERRREEFAEIV